jgi:hypothetical protein
MLETMRGFSFPTVTARGDRPSLIVADGAERRRRAEEEKALQESLPPEEAARFRAAGPFRRMLLRWFYWIDNPTKRPGPSRESLYMKAGGGTRKTR